MGISILKTFLGNSSFQKSWNVLFSVYLCCAVLQIKAFKKTFKSWIPGWEGQTQDMKRESRKVERKLMMLRGNWSSVSWPSTSFIPQAFCPLYLFWPTTFLLFPHVCAMGSVLEVSLAGGLRSGVFSSSPLKMRPVMILSYSIASSLSTETHPLFLPPVPKRNQLFLYIFPI